MSADILRFAEEPGGPNRLAILFTRQVFGEVRQLEATWDGEILVHEPRRDVVGAPWTYRLPDGRMLLIGLATTHLVLRALDVQIDGRPLPGSAFDPVRYLRRTSTALASCAFVLVCWAPLSLVAELRQDQLVHGAVALTGPLALWVIATRIPRSRAAIIAAVVVAAAWLLFRATRLQAVCLLEFPLGVAALLLSIDALRRTRQFGDPNLSAGS